MATYTAITDAEIDQDSPITQTLMTKYRDNLTAVYEGDDTAPRILSPALGLTYKTGSATRTSNGTSTIVTLDTTDLSNLADMTLALVTGHIEVSSTSNAIVEVNCNRATPTLLEKVAISTVTAYTSFSRIITLSSNTSISLSFDFSEAGTSSATVYGEILILGR